MTEKEKIICEFCEGSGFDEENHDCGEDTCVCVEAGNALCENCAGVGYYYTQITK
jgi:hypothetical protein